VQEGRSLPGGVKVTAVEERPLHADELAGATEAFLVADCTAVSLVSWGGSAIGGGKPGPAAKAFAAVLEGDLAA
jgi:branched-subunit amino acid aminotransferase/4-amino-4-deoxychorismate lyase